ncbi:MAG: hypothetical protein ABIG96_01040 [Candidatus Micrarchaeota archaeon]
MINSKAVENWAREKAEVEAILEKHRGIAFHLQSQDSLTHLVLSRYYGGKYITHSALADDISIEPQSVKARVEKIRNWLGIGKKEHALVLAHGPPAIHLNNADREHYFIMKTNPGILNKLAPEERRVVELVLGRFGFGIPADQAAQILNFPKKRFDLYKMTAYRKLGWK